MSEKAAKGQSPETIKQPSEEIGYRAVGRYFKSPPDKVRIMGRAILGLPVARALELLEFSPNKSALLLWKLVKSAMSNAEANCKRDVDSLWVKRIFVDRAAMLKRYHPCAHGRAKPILKRTCHITVQLESKSEADRRRDRASRRQARAALN
jgi:large subunit ribosomal protein L22